LAFSSVDDLVVLRGVLDQDYHHWLRSHQLGSDHVVAYNMPPSGKTLSELIVENPQPVKKMISKIGGKPIYVPWFSSRTEAAAANALGADLFGATESDTLLHNDKAAFKELCQKLKVPVVDGVAFAMQPENNDNFTQMESLVECYRSVHDTVIIRGTLGEAGISLYKTQGDDLDELYQIIAESGEKVVLIEPFLNVTSTPNDQWVVGLDGEITHIGMIEQLCEQGMVHVGSLKGNGPAPDVFDAIKQESLKIVTEMAESGYRGVTGFDYIVAAEGIFPVENNARFNGSSYVNMIVHNIEALIGTVPVWKFIKIKTTPCTFIELTKRIGSVLYDGSKSNSVFPYNCEDLSRTGNFAVVLLAEDMARLELLETSLKELGVKRD
jgi:carbamoylphosphate synthase large subunit